MENKLPDNFSDMVMASINTEIARREKTDETIMYSAIIGVGTVLSGIVIYMIYHYGWISKIKVLFNFANVADLFTNTASSFSFSFIWVIILANSLLIIGVFLYITNKKEKEFTSHV